jgi:hypothetical protein
VEHLSDVVSSLNVSHSSSIRKGTVEISGNGDAINEEKIKASDINAVVSVKVSATDPICRSAYSVLTRQVINQTQVVKDDATYRALYGVLPGTQAFNETFGDCYISGKIFVASH